MIRDLASISLHFSRHCRWSAATRNCNKWLRRTSNEGTMVTVNMIWSCFKVIKIPLWKNSCCFRRTIDSISMYIPTSVSTLALPYPLRSVPLARWRLGFFFICLFHCFSNQQTTSVQRLITPLHPGIYWCRWFSAPRYPWMKSWKLRRIDRWLQWLLWWWWWW